MGVFSEGNTIDSLLADLQTDVSDDFITRKQQRKKGRRMIEEVIEKHYKKKGSI